jgi:hypothetical protein
MNWKIAMFEPHQRGEVFAIDISIDDDEYYFPARLDVNEANALGAVLTTIWRRTEEYYDKPEVEDRDSGTPEGMLVRAFEYTCNPPKPKRP